MQFSDNTAFWARSEVDSQSSANIDFVFFAPGGIRLQLKMAPGPCCIALYGIPTERHEMELILTEEEVKAIWSDETLMEIVVGCENVVIVLEPSRKRKYLTATPTRVDFKKYSIDLGNDMVGELIVTVVIVPAQQAEA